MQKESCETEYYNTSYSRLKFELNLNSNKQKVLNMVYKLSGQKVYDMSDPMQKESIELDQRYKIYGLRKFEFEF